MRPAGLGCFVPNRTSVARHAPARGQADPPPAQEKWLYRPLVWSLVYLLGTFLIFFLTASATKLPSVWPMVLIPPAGAGMFAFGYWLRARSGVSQGAALRRRPPTALIALAALWSVSYGIAYLSVFGASGLPDFISVAANPGAAYRAKFDVFDQQANTGAVSLPVQLVTLTSGLMTLLVPLTIIWWKQLGAALRVLALTGTAMLLAPFAYAGTNQGFGYVALLVLVGVGVSRASDTGNSRPSRSTIALVALVLLGGLAFFLVGSIGRSEAFGTTNRTYNEYVANVVGEELAAALDSAIFYPTHGYLGLSESMTQDFVFSGGYGGSRALTRYAGSYFGLPDTFPLTYPARTQVATGYPSGRLWHTVYPWLASDLTFFGAVALMGLVGWAMARWWIRSVSELDSLSIGLIGNAAIFIAFVPANNQIGMSQVNLIGFLTLLTCYVVRAALRPKRQANDCRWQSPSVSPKPDAEPRAIHRHDVQQRSD